MIKSAIGEAVYGMLYPLRTPFSGYHWRFTLKKLLQSTHQCEVVLNPHQAEPAPIPYEEEFQLS